MNLSQALRRIRKSFERTAAPLIEVSLSCENLLHNLHTYQHAFPSVAFAPVLKSNAYGHGLVEVARILDSEKIAFIVVDALYEARMLRRNGIRSPLLVVGYTRPEDIARRPMRDTAFALVDLEQLRKLTQLVKKPVAVHLELDTGMHRHGLTEDDLPEALRLLHGCPQIIVAGVYSHLGDADSAISPMTDTQRARWGKMCAQIDETFPNLRFKHLAATTGVRFAKEAQANAVRLGIGLYGINVAPGEPLPLKLVLAVRTLISSIRTIPAGEYVGYNGTFITKQASRIATIPMGYFEGVDRSLSGVGHMSLGGKLAPIAGRVSMNMTSLDVTNIPEARVGDTVTMISRDRGAPNSVPAIAEQTGRIPYDILVHIAPHLRRVVE